MYLDIEIIRMESSVRDRLLTMLAPAAWGTTYVVTVALGKRWGSPGHPLVSTAWQMTLGGLMLVPVTLAVEGLPATLTAANVAGYTYLATIGGALAYVLWFRGIERLSPTTVSLLTLSNPLTATLAGFVVLGQTLTAAQVAGLGIALAALVAGQAPVRRARRSPESRPEPRPQPVGC